MPIPATFSMFLGGSLFRKKKREFGIIVPARVTKRSPGTRRVSFADYLELRL